ncbi:hypothetical protein F5Y14DRAFT_446298 [Nemania sp. NC0429]|nr:hypothetical protein F5Y14DRAFT_446298 [Nemania sp. NC0429]
MPIYTPVSAGQDFCLHCLRTLVKAYKKGGAAVWRESPLTIRCVFEAGRATRCAQCIKRKDICEPTTPAMLGDAADLVAILAWLRGFYVYEDADEGEYSAELRHAIGELTIDLVNSFENCEKECRKGHHLAGAKKTKASFLQAYEVFLAGRRDLALRAWPYPRGAAGDDPILVAKWKNGQLLRLLAGDPAASAWRIAKEAFYGALVNHVMIEVGADSPVDGEVEEVMEEFPVDI